MPSVPLEKPFIYSAYERPEDPGIVFTMPTMAQQHFKDECDINWIMDRYTKTGLLPENRPDFFYGDVSDGLTYQEALDFLNTAQGDFDSLPAKLRKRFDNDPGQLLDFLADPANKEEAIRLGLVDPPIQETPILNNGSTGSSETPQNNTVLTSQEPA